MTTQSENPGTDVPSSGRISGSITADLSHLSSSRGQLSAWLTDRVGPEAVEDIVLVFSELLTNAMSASPLGSAVLFRAVDASNEIRLSVSNRRDLCWVEPQPMPDPEAECGRGLALAEIYADKLEILLGIEMVEIMATFDIPADRFRCK